MVLFYFLKLKVIVTKDYKTYRKMLGSLHTVILKRRLTDADVTEYVPSSH